MGRATVRFRAKGEQLKRFRGLSPESHCQNLALTVVYVPYSLDTWGDMECKIGSENRRQVARGKVEEGMVKPSTYFQNRPVLAAVRLRHFIGRQFGMNSWNL